MDQSPGSNTNFVSLVKSLLIEDHYPHIQMWKIMPSSQYCLRGLNEVMQTKELCETQCAILYEILFLFHHQRHSEEHLYVIA